MLQLLWVRTAAWLRSKLSYTETELDTYVNLSQYPIAQGKAFRLYCIH